VTAPNGDVDTLIDVEAIGFTDKYVGLIPQTFANPDGSTWVQGTYLADTLAGSGASDGLRGGDGNDYLSGFGGNDYLEGEAGSDTLDVGAGNDYAWYGRTRAAFTLTQQVDGSVTVRDNSNGDTDTLISTEAIGFGDQPVVVVMQQRWDNASGGAWFDGSIFADTINGTNSADGVGGGDGNDVINGLGGNDYLLGEAGNDTIDGGLGNDYMFGGTGADTFVVTTTSGFDRIGDFNYAQGDRIKLSAGMSWGAGPDTNPADTWISFGANAGVALTGVNYTQVSSSWFV
jgi:Ca2+-binding RTX toxin-like protein